MQVKVADGQLMRRTSTKKKYLWTGLYASKDDKDKKMCFVWDGGNWLGVTHTPQALEALALAWCDPKYVKVPYFWTKYNFSVMVCSRNKNEHMLRNSAHSFMRLERMSSNPEVTWAVQVSGKIVASFIETDLAKRVAEAYWTRFGRDLQED